MSGSPDDGRPSVLATTMKSAIVVAGLSYVAASWLSSQALDRNGIGRLAFDVSGQRDPLTTGSLGAKINETKVDPCLVPRSR